MSKEDLTAIESALEAFVPPQWEEGKLTEFLGSSEFTRDIQAIQACLNQPIRDLVFRGGKRLRPMLFLTLIEGFNLDPKRYLHLAVAIELIHNGTLAVDDIEDNSELRRGKPALHTIYGVDVALNAGNAMYFLPLIIFLKENDDLSDQQRLTLFEIYAQEMINVHFGQAIDIHWHKELAEGISQNKYLEMCRLKTGSLIRMSVRFACAISNQDKQTEDAFVRFAESAGIAFQIKDDILDLTADPDVFGKQYGNDIREGKLSLPVILACEALSDTERTRLRDILHAHTSSKEAIEEARSLILKTDAIERAGEYAEGLLKEAWQGIQGKVFSEEGRVKLQQFMEVITSRKR